MNGISDGRVARNGNVNRSGDGASSGEAEEAGQSGDESGLAEHLDSFKIVVLCGVEGEYEEWVGLVCLWVWCCCG